MTGFQSKRNAAQAKQEPSQWRDMVVVTLVREGIDKHKARELADHFAAAQPEPVAYYHPRNGFYWAKPTSIFAPTVMDVPPMALYTTPPAAQPEQEAYGIQAISQELMAEFVRLTKGKK